MRESNERITLTLGDTYFLLKKSKNSSSLVNVVELLGDETTLLPILIALCEGLNHQSAYLINQWEAQLVIDIFAIDPPVLFSWA